MPTTQSLSIKQARRIAIGAQGFTDPPAGGALDRRHMRRALDRVKLLQIDSVNVLQRAHYLPLFARLGAYPPRALDSMTEGRKRELFEYWGHEASFIPLSAHRLFRWRMEDALAGRGLYSSLGRFAQERAAIVDAVYRRVREEGPLAASEMENGRGKGGWWGWSEVKEALELLFWQGRVTAAGRRKSFERLYDLPERVLPAEVLDEPTPTRSEALAGLVMMAAEAMGVASEGDLRSYFRLPVADMRRTLPELLEEGRLEQVSVAGWKQPAYLHPAARKPRRFHRNTLLSPFDSLVWDRNRCERLFGFHYRLEFYTPAEKRVFGYYVMPFLLGDQLIGRVDVKADRADRRLLVLGAWEEPGHAMQGAVEALWEALERLAAWLHLPAIHVTGPGDLAAALRRLQERR